MPLTQFFANKEAVFQVLGERYLMDMRRKNEAMFSRKIMP